MSELTPELLARHDGWLRALILRLVDDGQADDVLQEVWGHTLRTPPRDPAALPAWLATVARRVVSRRARGDRRRQARELQVARAADAESVDPAELVARVEERQQVAHTVLELDEPFRTVILLRYFEDQTPAQIAARLGVPVATVRTRLHRAHDKLRQRFERERGAGWRGQLALLCVPMGEAAAAPATAVAWSKVAALAALPLLLAVGLWWALHDGAGAEPVASPELVGSADAVTPPTVLGERVVVDLPGAAEDLVQTRVQPPEADTPLLAGRLLDHAGQPIPRGPILLQRSGVRDEVAVQVGVTDLRGHFAVPAPGVNGRLLAGGEWTTLRAWSPGMGSPLDAADDALIIAAPRIRVAGRVVDQAGEPVPDERVHIRFIDVHGFPEPTAGTTPVDADCRTTTDHDGRFELEEVPGFPLADLRVGGFRAVVPVPDRDTDDLVIVLGTGRIEAPRRSTPSKWRAVELDGSVRDSAARGIEGAVLRVLGELNPVETGADGGFRVHTRCTPDAPVVLVVAAPGQGPERHEVWVEGDAARVRVEVVLRGEEHAVFGRVVDEEGRPQAGLLVSLADATPFEHSSFRTRYLERPDGDPFGAHDRTTAEGEFRIPGVLLRAYRLRIFDVEAGFARTTGPVEPGRAVELAVPGERAPAPLTVQVVDRARRPVEGVEVAVSVVQLHVESDPSSGARASSTSFLELGADGTTDAEGGCRFDAGPVGEMRVGISKAGWIPVERDLGDGARTAIELTMLRQCPIRVDVPRLSEPHLRLVLFGPGEEELAIQPAWRGARRPRGWSFGVVRGRSVVAGVAGTVVRAELRELVGERVVATMQVVVAPSRVTVLDFPER